MNWITCTKTSRCAASPSICFINKYLRKHTVSNGIFLDDQAMAARDDGSGLIKPLTYYEQRTVAESYARDEAETGEAVAGGAQADRAQAGRAQAGEAPAGGAQAVAKATKAQKRRSE